MAAILDFWSDWFSLFLICKLPKHFQLSFESIGLSIQKKSKTGFQDDHHFGHLGFQIGRILAIFDLPVAQILPSFKSNGLSVQEKKSKIDFQVGHNGSHLGFLIRLIFAIFNLQVAQILPTKFWVNWPFHSEEEEQNRFSRWPPLRPS